MISIPRCTTVSTQRRGGPGGGAGGGGGEGCVGPGTEQVQVALYQPPEPVARTAGEQLNGIGDRGVHLVLALPLPRVRPQPHPVHEGAQVEVASRVHKADFLRRTGNVLPGPLRRAQRRNKLAEQGAGVEAQKHDAPHHRQAVTAETDPHQPPLGGEGQVVAATPGHVRRCRGRFTHTVSAGPRWPAECRRAEYQPRSGHSTSSESCRPGTCPGCAATPAAAARSSAGSARCW